jgi:hypothetical protein
LSIIEIMKIKNISGGALYLKLKEKHGHTVMAGSVTNWPDTEENRQQAEKLAKLHLVEIVSEVKAVPESFQKGLDDIKAGRVVDMEKAMQDSPPKQESELPPKPEPVVPVEKEVMKSTPGGGFHYGSVAPKPGNAGPPPGFFGAGCAS